MHVAPPLHAIVAQQATALDQQATLDSHTTRGHRAAHVAPLETSVAQLTETIDQQAETIEKLSVEREQYRRLYLELLERCALLERGIIGNKKAERVLDSDGQLTLQMLEMLLDPEAGQDAPPVEEPRKVREHERRMHGRAPLPEQLPRVEIELLPPEVQRGGLAKNSQMTLLAAAIREVSGAPDVLDFQEVCAAGQFYEASFEAHHGRPPTKPERSAWKGTVMGAWLYAHKGCMAHSDIGRSLAKRRPHVHAWMWGQKQRGVRDLPCEMQRREAAIWVDQLGPALEAIGCPGLTVHDSIYVPRSREAEVRAVLERLYTAAGVQARLA